jgi:hypothetical protein
MSNRRPLILELSDASAATPLPCTMISSTNGCPVISRAAAGSSSQVILAVGAARFIAQITGSTCTASPSALIITMQIRFPSSDSFNVRALPAA